MMPMWRTMTRSAAAVAAIAMAGGIAYAQARGAPAPRRHDVRIEAFEFQPKELRVAAGDTIVWTNRDMVPHTATDRSGKWDSGALQKAGTWKMVARTAGTYEYDCALHPTMTGTIVVR